jgi:hypothetical protein
MSRFEQRATRGVEWFDRHVIESPSGGAGWGWVPDVPPNPQNTAEVVCALHRLGREIPQKVDAIQLMRCEVVAHASQGDWAFRSLIDVAWRLRGLRCVVPDAEDADIARCVNALLDAQDPESGGWRMAGGPGAESVTATCMALRALAGLEGSEDTQSAVHRGLGMLIDAVLGNDPRVEPLYANAQIVQILSRHDIQNLDGPRMERALEKCIEAVVTALRGDEPPGIQEEIFSREGVTDIWRHMTLYLCLKAMADADPDHIFDPAFRRALIEMLGLQEEGTDNINFGGFRTSREGFVTSYATTQALQALASINTALESHVNPGKSFDLLCHSTGTHHSDPQSIVTIASRKVIMNSWGGGVIFGGSVVAALTIAGLTLAFQEDLGAVASRLLLTWSTLFLAGGTFLFASARLPGISNYRIALTIFTAFTAIFLPVIFFVFA